MKFTIPIEPVGQMRVKGGRVKYCEKEFLTDGPEPSTSTVVSFYGDVQWGRNDRPENLSFLEVSNCHERARLHRTYEMTNSEWLSQVRRLQSHIERYINFLETVDKAGEGEE